MLHFLEGGMGGHEKTGESIGDHAYALTNGAIYVESSQGHRGPSIYRETDTLSKIGYEATYAVVQYAKARAVQLYGQEPAHCYIYGQSGGGMRTPGILERFPALNQGGVAMEGVDPSRVSCFPIPFTKNTVMPQTRLLRGILIRH